MTSFSNLSSPEEPDNPDSTPPFSQSQQQAGKEQNSHFLQNAIPILKKLSKKGKNLQKEENKQQPQQSFEEKEERDKRQRLIFTVIVASIVGLLIAGGYFTFSSSKKKENTIKKSPVITQKTIPPSKQVELRNTERSVYSQAGEKTDAQGRKVEYILQTRINSVDGSSETLVTEKVNGILSPQWRLLQSEDLDSIQRTHPIVPPNQPGLAYSYGGSGTNENGETIDYLVLTDTRRQPARTFVRTYMNGQPASQWNRSLGFTPQSTMLATIEPSPPLASQNLQNSSKGVYAHAGTAQDEQGNQIEYILYTRWGGWGEEQHQETFVNKRVNGELSPTWTYLRDTDIPPTTSAKEGTVPANTPTQIYAYGGATTNAGGDSVEYIVAYDRYNNQSSPQVQEVINSYPASQTINIQDAPLTQAKPFISSKSSSIVAQATPIATRPVPQAPANIAQQNTVAPSARSENHLTSSSPNQNNSTTSAFSSAPSSPTYTHTYNVSGSTSSYTSSGSSSSNPDLVTRPANSTGFSTKSTTASSSLPSGRKPSSKTNTSQNSSSTSSSGSNSPTSSGPTNSTMNTTGSTTNASSSEMSEAERMFLNLFYTLRRFSVILLFIGVIAAALLFALGNRQMALNVIVAAAVLYGVPSIIILVMEALRSGS